MSEDLLFKRKHFTYERILRVGVCGTFFGHGLLALMVNPKWIPLLTVYGFSVETACKLMPIIGVIDVVVALIVLLYPLRIVIMWAAFWAFATAITRPIAGESFIEFVERSANWAAPLALLFIQGFPKKPKQWFSR